MTTTEKVIPRLKLRYRSEIAPALHKDFSYENVMQIPGVVKVVVNMGVGDAARDSKLIDGALRDLAIITGQRPDVPPLLLEVDIFLLMGRNHRGAHRHLQEVINLRRENPANDEGDRHKHGDAHQPRTQFVEMFKERHRAFFKLDVVVLTGIGSSHRQE